MQVKCLLLMSSVRACMLNHLTTVVKKEEERNKDRKEDRAILFYTKKGLLIQIKSDLMHENCTFVDQPLKHSPRK